MILSRRGLFKRADIAGGGIAAASLLPTLPASGDEPANPNPQGISLHLGLNSVDANAYAAWDGSLNACEFDAQDLAAIATADKVKKFKATTLLTRDATRKALFDALSAAAAAQLKKGDCFFLSYSGHGGVVADPNNKNLGQLDTTWCLWDGQVVDKELYVAWSKFADGVRILVVSDSCHSGSITKEFQYTQIAAMNAGPWGGFGKDAVALLDTLPRGTAKPVGYRAMPWNIAGKVYRQHQKDYDALLKTIPDISKIEVKAVVLLLSACQDNQLSLDGLANGKFTATLKAVLGDTTRPESWFSGN